jgi:hypothetical protein
MKPPVLIVLAAGLLIAADAKVARGKVIEQS